MAVSPEEVKIEIPEQLAKRLNWLFNGLVDDELRYIAEMLIGKPSWVAPYNLSTSSPKAWLSTGVFGTKVTLERLLDAFNTQVSCIYWDGMSLRVYPQAA